VYTLGLCICYDVCVQVSYRVCETAVEGCGNIICDRIIRKHASRISCCTIYVCCLPPRLGGLGLYRPSRMVDAAWLGSWAQSWAYMQRFLPALREISLEGGNSLSSESGSLLVPQISQ
jgi:hypothetical protein